MIQYVEVSHMEESVQHIYMDLNITRGSFTIETTFGLADSYLLRFIYGGNDYESGYFGLTMLEHPTHASNTQSTTTSLVQPTTFTSPSSPEATTTLTATEIPSTPNTNRNNGGGLSRDAKVGIGVGCSVAGIIGAAGFFIFYRRMKDKPVPDEPPNLQSAGPIAMELEGSSPGQNLFEVDGKHEAANLPELPPHPISSREIPL